MVTTITDEDLENALASDLSKEEAIKLFRDCSSLTMQCEILKYQLQEKQIKAMIYGIFIGAIIADIIIFAWRGTEILCIR